MNRDNLLSASGTQGERSKIPHVNYRTGPRGEAINSLRDGFRMSYFRIASAELERLEGSQSFIRQLLPGERTDIANLAVDAFMLRLTTNDLPGQVDLQKSIRSEVMTVLENGLYVSSDCKDSEGNRRCPTAKEQLKRNEELIAAVRSLEGSPRLRQQVLNLAGTMFKSGFPVEMFNDQGLSTLSETQVNDLTDNFVLWTLLNDPNFNNNHKLAVYLYMFEGLDAQAAHEKVCAFERRDTYKERKRAKIKEKEMAKRESRSADPQVWKTVVVNYGLTPEVIDNSYTQVAGEFERNGAAMLEHFLSEANLNETETRKFIPNYDELVANRDSQFNPSRRLIKGTLPSKVGAEEIYRSEKRCIKIPENELEKCLDNILVMLLQRGNTAARNLILIRLVRMFGAFARGPYARYKMSEYGAKSDVAQDLEQELVLKALEKLAITDPRLSRVSTYVGNWTQSVVDRFCMELEAVHHPVYVHEKVRRRRKELRNSQEEETAEPEEVTPKKGKESTTDELIRRGLICVGKSGSVSMNEPVGEDGSVELGDFMPEVAVGHDWERIMEFTLDEQTIGILTKAFDCLPPRDAYVLKQRIFAGRTLEDIGSELGVSRERARQLQKRILLRFELMRRPTGQALVVVNEPLLRKWCEEKIESEVLRERFYLELGMISGSSGRQVAVTEDPIEEGHELGEAEEGGTEDGETEIPEEESGAETEQGLGFDHLSLRKQLGELRRKLKKNMQKLPEEERCALCISNVEMYKRARVVLEQLEEITGKPTREIMGSVRRMLEITAKSHGKGKEEADAAAETAVVENVSEGEPQKAPDDSGNGTKKQRRSERKTPKIAAATSDVVS
ncbi:MAG: sigma-70 family RNA polymerase sigma factor [Candidatus Gracilibacteria bacterium]